MPPQPSSKQALHIAKEVVKGTAQAAPTSSIPIRKFTGGRAKTKLPDQSLRGSAVDSYSEADGVYHGVFSVEGDVFPDSIGHLLLSIFGEEVVTGAAAPYAHAFTVFNGGDQQPPGHTLWDNYGVNIRRYAGAQCTALNLSWEDAGLLAYSAEFMTLGDTPVAEPVASYGTLAPHSAWSAVANIGGGAALPLSGECNISRNAEAVHVQDGLQAPRYIWVGSLTVEGTVVLLMEADTYYQQFIDNTQPALEFNFADGGGATSTGLRLYMNKATWRDPTIDRSASYVKLSLGYKALGNTADAGASGGYSPIKATLTNARATAY